MKPTCSQHVSDLKEVHITEGRKFEGKTPIKLIKYKNRNEAESDISHK